MRGISARLVVVLSLMAAGTAAASEGFDDLVRLLSAQQEAALDYVRNSGADYNLSQEEIDYLHHQGFSPRVIDAAIRRSRELHPVVVQAPAVVQVFAPAPEHTDLSLFYEALAPHGEWIDINGAWVWRPNVAVSNPAWRPYLDSGHWVYTDAGWAWHSDYEWGWAPFHYGRWQHHAHHGWVWTPDTTWGPAWVNWRTSDSHLGWAPLPPAARFEEGVGLHIGGDHLKIDITLGLNERDYCFVPTERVCERQINTYVVPPERINVVYNNTTIIQNNITYVDKRVIVNGPPIEQVRVATRHEIPVVRIADAPVQVGVAIHGNALHGNTFEVYRPPVKNVAPVTPAVIVARQQAAQLKRDTTQQIKSERILSAAEREAAKRETNAAAKQEVLDAHADAHNAKKEESAAEAAARIQAREREAAARTETREVRRDAVETKREETAAETQARIRERQQLEAQKAAQNTAEAQARAAAHEKLLEAEKADAAAKASAREKALEAEKQAKVQSSAEAQARAAAEAQARAAAREKALEAERADAAAKAAAREKALEAERQAALAKHAETAAETAARIKEREQAEAQRKADAQAKIDARKDARETKKEAAEAKKEETKAEREAKKNKKEPVDPNAPVTPPPAN